MSSFLAAGTSYATHGVPMIPFYIYYSMFGPQRVGDLFWLAGDIRARGFLLGATSGRTSLNGEGLQHQDGHSLLHASTIPTCLPYDPAFGFEIAVIIADGLRRMYVEQEDIFYYLALYNESYAMAPMPAGVEDGIVKGLYKFKPGSGKKIKAHIFGSGSIMQSALKAQAILAEKYGVSADVWSATSYKLLRTDAIRCQRWNMLHPTEPREENLSRDTCWRKSRGAFVAVSDNIRTVPDQIAPWVPGGLLTLGTDGFGRSDTRARLRRFFGVDAESTVIGTLYALAEKESHSAQSGRAGDQGAGRGSGKNPAADFVGFLKNTNGHFLWKWPFVLPWLPNGHLLGRVRATRVVNIDALIAIPARLRLLQGR